jgi:hypothetical protein
VLQPGFHGGGAFLLIAFKILYCDATKFFRIDFLKNTSCIYFHFPRVAQEKFGSPVLKMIVILPVI